MGIAAPTTTRLVRLPRTSRGMTLVELMIGMAIGLFLVAVGSTLLVTQMKENRSLLVDARLMQDLRTAADLMTRDLRREGYWGAATAGVWAGGGTLHLAINPYQAAAPATAASDATSLRYSRDVVENNLVDSNEQFGYRLRQGVIDLQLGNGNWQALTDAGTLYVVDLRIEPRLQTLDLAGSCARPCPAGSLECPPRQSVRSLSVTITARSVSDPAVRRSLRSDSRVRNDAVIGTCPSV